MSEYTAEQARVALDDLDDFARMDTGVDAMGPREVLEGFIEQQAALLRERESAGPLSKGARIAELEDELSALRQRIANAPNCRAKEVYIGGRMARVATIIDQSAIGKRVRLLVDQDGDND